MNLDFKNIRGYDDHEEIIEIEDQASGLRGFVAIYSTLPGPALGATRMCVYQAAEGMSPEECAVSDAMRLAKGMSYKCAIAKLPYGGGKAVLIGDPQTQKTPALLEAYAKKINEIGGKFVTGEDVGMFPEDVYYMQQFSKFFIGAKDKAGDSSPYAALGTFFCIQQALAHMYNDASVRGRTIAIKGLGKTGLQLAKLVIENGGNVVASDVDSAAIIRASGFYPQIKIVQSDEIYTFDADVFAPCALGDDLNQRTLEILKPRIICGVANNQLHDKEIADRFFEKGYLYVPDYLSNAGGLIDVADELEPGGYSRERVLSRIADLRNTCAEVLETSTKENIPPHRVSDRIAEKAFKKNV